MIAFLAAVALAAPTPTLAPDPGPTAVVEAEPAPTAAAPLFVQGVDANGVVRMICTNGVIPRVHLDMLGNPAYVECPPAGECIPGWRMIVVGESAKCIPDASLR